MSMELKFLFQNAQTTKIKKSIINNMNLPSFIPLFFGSSRNLYYYVHVSVRNKLLTGYKALRLCSQELRHC